MKLLKCSEGRNYYVRPGQLLNVDKFHSEDIKFGYQLIKGLKKALGLNDLKMFMVKKELKKDVFREIRVVDGDVSFFLFRLLSQGEFRAHFDRHVDFGRWEEYLEAGFGGYSQLPIPLFIARRPGASGLWSLWGGHFRAIA